MLTDMTIQIYVTGQYFRDIDRLYAESPNEDTSSIDVNLVEANFRRVQTQCTLTLAIMFTIDLLVPVVIPTALYVVRKRPIWFKNLITQLYADKLAALELNRSVSSSQAIKQMSDDELQQKLAELDASNLDAAKLLLMKNNRRLSNG